VYLQKVLQLFRTEIRKNFIANYKSGSIGLAGYPSHFVESDSISPDVDSTKLVSVFVKVFLRQITPRATGFHVKKQLRLIHQFFPFVRGSAWSESAV
jgi:hypothetical protein